MRTTVLASRAALGVLVLLAGCGVGSGEGGMGLPAQVEGEVYPGPRRELVGQLDVAANGCAYVVIDDVARLAIWPRGSTLLEPVRLPDGTGLNDHDPVVGTGTILAADELPGGRDGYWGHVTGFCTGDVPEVIVFDEAAVDE